MSETHRSTVLTRHDYDWLVDMVMWKVLTRLVVEKLCIAEDGVRPAQQATHHVHLQQPSLLLLSIAQAQNDIAQTQHDNSHAQHAIAEACHKQCYSVSMQLPAPDSWSTRICCIQSSSALHSGSQA